MTQSVVIIHHISIQPSVHQSPSESRVVTETPMEPTSGITVIVIIIYDHYHYHYCKYIYCIDIIAVEPTSGITVVFTNISIIIYDYYQFFCCIQSSSYFHSIVILLVVFIFMMVLTKLFNIHISGSIFDDHTH